jgi:tripartite-type tricarboxylate transporter receptor subunit TctC
VRALAITGSKRMPQLPDVPTLAELGIRGFEGGNWTGMWMPAATPPEVVRAFQQAMSQVLTDPAVAERFRALGAEPVGNTPEQFTAQFRGDVARFADIIEKAKIPKLD